MFTATIRPRETQSVEVQGPSLEDIQLQLAGKCPPGFELVSAPVAMQKGSSVLTATGTFARRDGLRDIEADTMDQLRELTPEGWQMLSVRAY